MLLKLPFNGESWLKPYHRRHDDLSFTKGNPRDITVPYILFRKKKKKKNQPKKAGKVEDSSSSNKFVKFELILDLKKKKKIKKAINKTYKRQNMKKKKQRQII